MSWHDARLVCRSYGGDLVVPKDYNALAAYFQPFGPRGVMSAFSVVPYTCFKTFSIIIGLLFILIYLFIVIAALDCVISVLWSVL